MARFRQLNYDERTYIAIRLQEDYSIAEIARDLLRSRSTIKREIDRNGFRGTDGNWHYHPDIATKKYWHRQSKARYGKGFRRFYGERARYNFYMNGFPDPYRRDKEQWYRYRPFLWLKQRADRIPTVDKDWRRYNREAEWRDDRKTYIYPKKGWPTPHWLLPERKNRKLYIPWNYGFQWLEQRPDEKPREGRRWSMFWLNRRWKEDTRKNRKKKPRFYYWPVGIRQVFMGTIRPPESKKPMRRIPFLNTRQKPESFRMEELCPAGSNFGCFSKNETSPGVDKSVLFINPGFFSQNFPFSF